MTLDMYIDQGFATLVILVVFFLVSAMVSAFGYSFMKDIFHVEIKNHVLSAICGYISLVVMFGLALVFIAGLGFVSSLLFGVW